MTPAEYAAFVAWMTAAHDPETAARLIEERCHPPLPAHLQRGPVVEDRSSKGGAA